MPAVVSPAMRLLIVASSPLPKPILDELQQNEYEIESVEDLEGDVKLSDLNSYNFVMLDQSNLRRPDSTLICRWRKKGLMANIIVLLPQDSETIERAACLDMGADAYLEYPPNPAEMCALLRAFNRRQMQTMLRVRRIHDLEIDLAARKVKRGDQIISLTPLEFSLLEFLSRTPGQAVSRRKILKHLYSDEERPSNVVDAYVSYLRKKVDRDFDEQLILSSWGEGYYLRQDNDEGG